MFQSLKEDAEYYAKETNLPLWAHVIICTYFDHRPVDKTQNEYKEKGLKCFEYILNEIYYILQAIWKKNEEFMNLPYVDYLLNKYNKYEDRIVVSEMDLEDRKNLIKAFAGQLGINWTILPFFENEIFE